MTVVDPGVVDTLLWSRTAAELAERLGTSAEQVTKQIVAQTPLGTLTSPDDVARLVGFLLWDASAQLTGVAIALDGGACPAL